MTRNRSLNLVFLVIIALLQPIGCDPAGSAGGDETELTQVTFMDAAQTFFDGSGYGFD